MSSALLFSAIPFVMRLLGDRFNIADTLEAIHQARNQKRTVHLLFCTFEWDMEIQTMVGADCGARILVRDVVELPEFRARFCNVLSKRGKHKCTMFPVERDLKVLKDDDVECDEAMVLVKFEPWGEDDVVAPGACILRGNKTDIDHVRNKYGVCWHCGGFEG